MARISLDPPVTPTYRLARWYSRRTYQAVLDPGAAMAHHPRLLRSYLPFERSVARWNRLDPTLAAIAQLAAAAPVGCSWCLDFGYWENTRRGVDPIKLRDVPAWRDSNAYTDVERRVLEYAEAMCADPVAVTDEMVDALRQELDDAQLVELTMLVALRRRPGGRRGGRPDRAGPRGPQPREAHRAGGPSAAGRPVSRDPRRPRLGGRGVRLVETGLDVVTSQDPDRRLFRDEGPARMGG